MKKTSVFNNVSAKFLKEVDSTFKRNETVAFHLVGKQQKPWAPGQWLIPMQNVPSVDVVFDPHANEYKEIAYIVRLLPNDGFELGEIIVSEASRPTPGAITLRGDVVKDRELYRYLYMSNFWDRADRDDSKDLILRLERPGEKAAVATKDRKDMVKAVAFAVNMTKADIVNYASAKGKDPSLDESILRDFVEASAVSDPVAFLHEVKSNRTTVKAAINKAVTKKHLQWDAKTSSWKWAATKEQILSVPRNKSKFKVDHFVSFILEHENGPSVLQSIESLL